jgi:hypothetical protein
MHRDIESLNSMNSWILRTEGLCIISGQVPGCVTTVEEGMWRR